jgi:hypothetical protein
MNTLKVICADCKKVIKDGPDVNISHGQCDPCQDKFLWIEGLSEKELSNFINEKELRRQYA